MGCPLCNLSWTISCIDFQFRMWAIPKKFTPTFFLYHFFNFPILFGIHPSSNCREHGLYLCVVVWGKQKEIFIYRFLLLSPCLASSHGWLLLPNLIYLHEASFACTYVGVFTLMSNILLMPSIYAGIFIKSIAHQF